MLTKLSLLAFAFTFGSTLFAQTSLPPFTGEERGKYLLKENFGPVAILEDVAGAAINTASNTPKEYGPHWEGFGKRTGLIAANYGVRSVIEASLGSMWGEDPRYEAVGGPFKNRLGHAIKMTFVARNRDGGMRPAFARLIAVPTASFLANSWYPDSERSASDAAVRVGFSFLSHMAGNLYKELRSHH